MKKIIAWVLVIALTAAVSVAGTMAYLADTDEDTNVMTVGNVKIDQLKYEHTNVEDQDEDAVFKEFHNDKPLYPAVTDAGVAWENKDSYVKRDDIGKPGYTSEIWDPNTINNEMDKMILVKNKYICDKNNGLWYELQGDYYIPCLMLDEIEENT